MRNIIVAHGNSITRCIDHVAFNESWPYKVLAAAGDTVTQGTYVRHSDATNVNNLLLGTNHTIYNVGGGGGTTAWMLSVMSSDVRWYGPGLLVLTALATNDINTGVAAATTQANVTAMLDLARSWGMRVVVANTIANNTFSAAQNTQLAAYNAWEAATCAARGIPHLDIYTPTQSGGVLQNTVEGIHLNAAGNTVLANAWSAAFGSNLAWGTGKQRGAVAAYSPAHHLFVHRDGTLLDHVTGLSADITGALATSARPSGKYGYNGTFDTSVIAAFPGTRMNRLEGTVIVVQQNALDNTTRKQWEWRKSAGATDPYIFMHTGTETYPKPAGWLFNGSTNYATFGTSKTNTAEYAHALRWKNGEGVTVYNDGAAGSATAAITAAASMPDRFFVGRAWDTTGAHGTGISQVICYDTALTAAQIAEVSAAALVGWPVDSVRRNATLKNGVTVWR